jgi:hypothetical protein
MPGDPKEVNRSFADKRLIVAVFLEVVRPFDTIWVAALLCKLSVLQITAYTVKSISCYFDSRTCFHSYLIPHVMAVGVAQGRLCAAVFWQKPNDVVTSSRHVGFEL